MKKSSKILIFISCLFLLSIYITPLWYIKLDAPQYPGGLDMYIWINKITGTDEFTIQNINILNHYIGMDAIHPDSFPELEIMPYVLASFILLGVFAVFINNKKFLIGWLLILIVGGTIGLVDFYIWQQAFGNNLDPTAPIKIPGMTYSPPFLGIKTILNIKATSLPHLGGLAFGLAILAAVLAVISEFRSNKKNHNPKAYYAALALMLLMASCTPEQQPIEYGFDSCEHCKMTISDNRYGTEIVTKKGKAYKFDSIECMVFYTSEKNEESSYEMILVTDFMNPGKFIDGKLAWYLQSEELPSPMGMNLTAFEKESDVKEIQLEQNGSLLQWDELIELIKDPQSDLLESENFVDKEAFQTSSEL